jgi:hypothetical protein
MLIPKHMVVEHLRARADSEAAERADRELDEKVDTERDRDALSDLGIHLDALEEDFRGQSPAIG